MKLCQSLFWIHLAAGSLAGVVILIMALTGVCLAYERQVTEWANRGYKSVPHFAAQKRRSMDELTNKVQALQGDAPSSITLMRDAESPVQFGFGGQRIIFVDVYTGTELGESSTRLRAFFSEVETVHRFLGASENWRVSARALTGACNLLFLVLVSTGPFLWWPKDWTWKNLRKIATPRPGLAGRARDWNWHNALGIWCFGPLLLIVLTGVVMSYSWANNLLYRIAGNQPPLPQSAVRQSGPQGSGQGRFKVAERRVASLDVLFQRAERQVPGWSTISLRLPASAHAPLVLRIEQGDGGRPDNRAQLTLDPTSGEVTRWEPFSSYGLGRRLRLWVRFTHTGEAGGIFGQSIAATASVGAAVLVWTGLALARRRCNGWRKRSGLRSLAQS